MPDLHHALPALLQGFSDAMRREAERLAEDCAIVTLDLADGRLDAEVMLDDKPVHVVWSMESSQWESETDAQDDGLHQLASCLALVGLQRNSTVQAQQSPMVEETFQMQVERKLERQLRSEEEAYLSKIEKRFERVRKTKEIFDHDMVRLHPKWNIQSTDALELWDDAPKSALEFWNYVALALQERALPFPSFLKPVTDIDATKKKLQGWKQNKDLPQWQDRIRRFTQQRIPQATLLRPFNDLRLLITTSDAKLQARDSDTLRWSTLSAAQLGELRREQARGALVLPAEAELLLVTSLLQMQHSEIDSFRLELERHASWLATLFHQSALQSRLVNLDETSFVRPADALRWSVIENTAQQAFSLKLVMADGSPTPLPMRVLAGVQTLYLSVDSVFRGPTWFGETTLVDAQIVIPEAALASTDGVAFLEKLDAPLPPSIASRLRHEPLKVEITANCAKAPASTGTNYTHLRVTASSPDGRHREVLCGSTWQVESSQPHQDGTIAFYERKALDEAPALLEGLRANFEPETNSFRLRMTRNFPDTFFGWASQLPETIQFTPDEHLGTILADPLIARVRLEATQTATIDWFDLRVVFDIEGVDLKPAEIRKLISANGGFVRLADGTWRRVKIELSEEQQDMVAQLGIDLNDLNEEAHRVHWRHLTGDKGAGLLSANAWAKLQQRLADAEIGTRPDVPTDLAITLRSYQVDGFHFLSYLAINRFGGILADDMGLGKTVQTIAWVLWLRQQWDGTPPPTIVVCPKSVLDVWAIEFRKAAPHMRVQVLHDKDELDMSQLTSGIDVLVLNYAQLRSTIDSLKNITFLAAILDEGQQIKNPDSKAARAAREVNAHNRLVLTGTPMENRLLDLWSLMAFATPGALGDRAYFTKHFDRRKDERASQRLSARLRPFILRRTKSQVAKELPPRTEENMLCEMSGVQEQMYRDELANAQNMVLTAVGKDALQRRRFALLQALTRLRQICCHPGLANPAAMGEESAKLTAALDLIEQLHEEGHKVLFFSQFVSMLKIVRSKLEEMNLPYHWLTGASENRSEIVRNFQEDPNASVFLISLKAGGAGLNLTAASYVILYDPWWNPAVENQAIDRAHRIGQTQPVIAYRLISRSSIEEKILMLQQQKQILAGDVLGEQTFAQNLGREDFEFLLGLEDREEQRRAALKKDRDEW